jgi:hypothetical protein
MSEEGAARRLRLDVESGVDDGFGCEARANV